MDDCYMFSVTTQDMKYLNVQSNYPQFSRGVDPYGKMLYDIFELAITVLIFIAF